VGVRRLAITLLALLAFRVLLPAQAAGTVILISLDGFRWDYFDKAPTPHLHALIARGVKADNLIPSFPSKTFPNHYTVVTGLYPGHHGILANNIRDPATGRTFGLAKRAEIRDAMWWGGEPIWVGAQRAGRHTAPLFWPGAEAPIGGIRPTYGTQAYNDGRMTAAARIDQVLAWLDLPPAKRPTFLTLYFEETDDAGHDHGPDSEETRRAIQRADGYIGRLVAGLTQRHLLDRVNIVVVSDHGMSSTNTERVIALDDYIRLSDVDIVDINPTLALAPKPGKDEAVYRALAKAHPRLKVYRRRDTPAHWHYRDHPRIPPIVGVADEGWQVLRRQTLLEMIKTLVGGRGTHGYDPQAMSMRAIFVAAGPAFKQGLRVPAFENVHVYHVLARVLGVPAAKNDGRADVARRILR
jgi:predicted AlkP superfamily pyrophosphatase or phosphodiesterase